MNYILLVYVLINVFVNTSTEQHELKWERYIIACHSTDFECFKRQYLALRDNVLLGNKLLDIGTYLPYVFSYGDTGTCVRITGVEDSKLTAVSLNLGQKAYSISIELPINIQQISNTTSWCAVPDKRFEKREPNEFGKVESENDVLKNFSGNATVSVSYPYKLRMKMDKLYMLLEDENMDVVLDIPDFSQYDRMNSEETRLFEWSEWAYDMVQHVDLAQHCMVHFTRQLRKFMERVPLEKFLLLYPDEKYSELQFSFNYSKINMTVE